MEECVLLSSDTESYVDDKENLDEELSQLLKKYENYDSTSQGTDSQVSLAVPNSPKRRKVNNDVSASSDSEPEEIISIIPASLTNKKVTELSDSDVETEILPVPIKLNDKQSLKQLKQAEKEEKLRQKNEEKAQKQAERERKKAEAEKTKAEKRKLAEAYNLMRPEEAIKQVLCIIDNRLSDEIILELEQSEISCKSICGDKNKLPSVTWQRKAQPQLANINGQLSIQNEEEIMPTLYIIQHSDLLKRARSDQILPLAVGTKGAITLIEIDNNKPQRNEEKDIESALIELQIMSGWSHRKIKTNVQLIEVIRQYTKSVALAPSKRLKASSMSNIVQPPTSDCVRVQNNTGHGLAALWLRQLGQFPLAALETAHAVMKVYPTPKSLANSGEGKEVVDELADEQVRRAHGPLSAPRRLGPQLAKRIHMALTSRNPDAILS